LTGQPPSPSRYIGQDGLPFEFGRRRIAPQTTLLQVTLEDGNLLFLSREIL